MRLVFVILLCFPCQAVTLLRVACGSNGGADAGGNVWSADQGFSGGYSWSAVNQPSLGQQPAPYNAMRASSAATPQFSYTLTPSGPYNSVTLKFIEPNKTAAGQRVFNVSINGSVVFSAVDIFSQAGAQLKPVDLTAAISGTGPLTITLSPTIGNAVLSGIEIDGPAPATGLTSLSGLESARPANCPGPSMVFYVATDTKHLLWCSPAIPIGATDSTPWTRILQDVATVVPGLAIVGTLVNGVCQPHGTGFHPSLTDPPADSQNGPFSVMVSNETQGNCTCPATGC